jgi:hypothetical protein
MAVERTGAGVPKLRPRRNGKVVQARYSSGSARGP